MPISGGMNGSGGDLSFSVTIDPDDFAMLNSSPALISIPSPGAGFTNFPTVAVYQYTGATSLLHAGIPTLQINWTGKSDVLLSANTDLANNLINSANFSAGGVVGATGENLTLEVRTTSNIGFVGALSNVIGIDGGLGYAVGDTGDFFNGAVSSATYEVDTVDGLGTILTFAVTAGGNNYIDGEPVNGNASGAQPGIGTGFNGSAVVTVNQLGTLVVTGTYVKLPV